MRTQALGKSTLVSSRLAYGCMRINAGQERHRLTPGQEAAARGAILAAWEAGYTHFDHADIYGNGVCEEIFGRVLREVAGMRDRVLVASKCGIRWRGEPDDSAPHRWDFSREHILRSCEDSLERLGTDRIDLYFAHQDDEATPQEAALEAFGKLVAAGKVRVVGASNFHAARLKSANEAARAAGLPRYDVLQPEYNLVSRHKFEGELQDYCVSENVGVVPYYGLASGFLTGKYRGRDDLGKSVRGGRMTDLLEGKGKAVLAAMDGVVAETGASHAQVALAWLKTQPGVTAPIASATSVAQLSDLLGALTLELTPEQQARLTDAGA